MGGIYRALTGLLTLGLLLVFWLLVRNMNVAVGTIPNGASAAERTRIESAKRDARRNVIWLTIQIIVVGIAATVWSVAWRDISFRANYTLWRLNLIRLEQLIDSMDSDDYEGERLLDSTQVPLVPAVRLKWLRADSNVIDDAAIVDALRLITQKHSIEIHQPIHVAGEDGRMAVIAAKSITFRSGGRVIHGSRPILMIANEFHFDPGSRIEAWGDVPAKPTLDGAKAGEARIISLGKVSGSLIIDGYGQKGGDGAPGSDAPAWTDKDRPSALRPSASVVPSRVSTRRT